MLRSITIAGAINGDDRVNPTTFIPPQIFTNPVDVPSPLPPGASVSETTLPPSWIAGKLDGAHMEKYYKVGAALQDRGIGGGFDFKSALAAVGTGAAIGGVWGGAVGAVVFVVNWLLGGGSSSWDNTGPGVHAYISALMPEVFAGGNGWAWNNAGGSFDSVPNLRAAFLGWTVQEWGIILDPMERIYAGAANSTFFRNDVPDWSVYGRNSAPESVRTAVRNLPGIDSMPQWVIDQYAMLGIDFHASVKERRAGKHEKGFAMINKALQVDGLLADGSVGARSSDDDTSGFALGAAAFLGFALLKK